MDVTTNDSLKEPAINVPTSLKGVNLKKVVKEILDEREKEKGKAKKNNEKQQTESTA